MRVWFSGPRIFGVRTGISVGLEDFRRMRAAAAPARVSAPSMPELVYVISNGRGEVKIGVSGDPLVRRDKLQTGSPDRLVIAYAAAAKSGNAFPVENVAKESLARFRREGEWFAVEPAVAVAAIAAASHRLGDPIVQIAEEHLRYAVDRARAEAAAGGRPAVPETPPTALRYAATATLPVAMLMSLALFAPNPDANTVTGIVFVVGCFFAVAYAASRFYCRYRDRRLQGS